jgi:hypothetical protein
MSYRITGLCADPFRSLYGGARRDVLNYGG